jgi:hypothetical protein
MDEAQQNTIHSILLSKECGFARSLVGEQKIRTINISEWTEPKAAQIPVTVAILDVTIVRNPPTKSLYP